MLESVRSFISSHHDVSQLVRDARKFSVNVPVLGRVSVPPPNHLAFYSALGVLGVTELIPWPIAVGIGVGHALASRRADVSEVVETPAPAEDKPTRLAAPAEKPSPRKAPAKQTSPRKATARATPAKRAAAKKTPAKKAPAKKGPPRAAGGGT